MKSTLPLSTAIILGLFATPAHAASCADATSRFNKLTDEFAAVFNSMESTAEYQCSNRFRAAHEKLVKLTRQRIPYAKVLESCPAENPGSSVADLERFIAGGEQMMSELAGLCAELAQEERTKDCVSPKTYANNEGYECLSVANGCGKDIRFFTSSTHKGKLVWRSYPLARDKKPTELCEARGKAKEIYAGYCDLDDKACNDAAAARAKNKRKAK